MMRRITCPDCGQSYNTNAKTCPHCRQAKLNVGLPHDVSPAVRKSRNSVVAFLIVIVGFALLLPGLCTVFFAFTVIPDYGTSTLFLLVPIGLVTGAIAYGGVTLIRRA